MKPYKTILLSLLILPLPLLLGSCEIEEEIENGEKIISEIGYTTPDGYWCGRTNLTHRLPTTDPILQSGRMKKALQDTVIRNFRTIPTE